MWQAPYAKNTRSGKEPIALLVDKICTTRSCFWYPVVVIRHTSRSLTDYRLAPHRQDSLPLTDQGVTVTVRYDRYSFAKPLPRLYPRQHLRPDARRPA